MSHCLPNIFELSISSQSCCVKQSPPPPLFAIVNVQKRNNSKSTTQTKFTNKIIHKKGLSLLYNKSIV